MQVSPKTPQPFGKIDCVNIADSPCSDFQMLNFTIKGYALNLSSDGICSRSLPASLLSVLEMMGQN